ncbi:hypothetical protein NON00_19480 [Roseomonas sp. GC11]|uniref:hypothetical protein n=1 Tax=Roseomonas sp. GC11 TaxID=2950546 RepID=UPI00210C64C9|nr:hypothetical protein [Roseomonas sp. GC11]MCQ4162100.1 hypothetical protein [Roseomonas sp. GC11]
MLLLKPEEDLVLCQSADPVNYFAMLRSTAKATQDFCVRQNVRYLCLSGVLRGYHPWHACYNRIIIMHQLMQTGFEGWYLHLDADAFVHDPEFDIRGYLAGAGEHSFIFTHGATREPWDVNDGVYLANFAHPHTRTIIARWMQRLEAIPAERLKNAAEWYQTPCDQRMLHLLLRAEPELASQIRHEHPRFINGQNSSFIRQVLRAHERDPALRLMKIALQVEHSMALRQRGGEADVALLCGISRALGLPLPKTPADIQAATRDQGALLEHMKALVAEARQRQKAERAAARQQEQRPPAPPPNE